MRKSINWALLASLAMLANTVALAADPAGAKQSGFLGGEAMYARQQEVVLRDGMKAQRWIAPDLRYMNYRKVLIDEVMLYPKPEPGPQVSAGTLDEMGIYTTGILRERMASSIGLADGPGEGVLRIQAAITGFEVKTEGMKRREILPVAAALGLLSTATGTRDRKVYVYLEARLVDSRTGELMGTSMRRIQGEDLEGKKDQLTLDDMRKSLDEAAADAADGIVGMLAAGA